jgi:isoleucyl-tRNA synthetase
MYRIAEAFVRWIAPVLSFTADEMWQHLPANTDTGPRLGHVLFATWYEGLVALPDDAPLNSERFNRLLDLREQVYKVMEPMRASGEIGAALEAEISINILEDADSLPFDWIQPLQDELHFLFITGEVKVIRTNVPVLAIGDVSPSVKRVYGRWADVSIRKSEKPKCTRCWHHRDDVGSHPDHPEICGRCVSNVEGPGEERRWF